jgi:hypothetical protein
VFGERYPLSAWLAIAVVVTGLVLVNQAALGSRPTIGKGAAR